MEVTITLKNPPAGANGWVFNVTSHDETHKTSCLYHTIDEPITQEVLADWFPLYSSIAFFSAPYTAPILEITNVPSLSWYSGYDASLPLITEHGSYYYNAATKQFELLEPPELVACEITITAPDSAGEGEKVSVSALLKNLSSYGIMYKTEIWAVPDLFPAFRIGTIEKYINSGSTFTAYGSFTMPASNTTVYVVVERWAVDHWVYDNTATRAVSLGVPATYHLSIFVPPWAAGGYIDPGSGDYPANTTVKLTAHPLSGYQFTGWGGDASGTASTYNLHMDSDKNVEAYFEPVPVPEYKGSIARKELEYNETRGAIPIY